MKRITNTHTRKNTPQENNPNENETRKQTSTRNKLYYISSTHTQEKTQTEKHIYEKEILYTTHCEMEILRQRICTKTETTMRLIYESDIDDHTNKQNTKNKLARRIINIIKNISSREDNNGWKSAYLAMKLRMQIKEIIYWTRNRYSLKERIWNNIINERTQKYDEPRKRKKFPFSLLNLLLSINATIPHHAATTPHHAATTPHHAAITLHHAATRVNVNIWDNLFHRNRSQDLLLLIGYFMAHICLKCVIVSRKNAIIE